MEVPSSRMISSASWPAGDPMSMIKGSEGLHADDPSGGTDITLRSQRRSLLDGDTRLDLGRPHALTVDRALA
jgi:hypothetical protein